MRHVGKELGLDARGFLRALFRQIQLHVLDLHLLKRFPQIRGGLVDVMLHFLMIGGQRHGHRIDAVFQHIQLAKHKAFNAAIELPSSDAVNGIDHIANRPRDILHQPPAEDQRNTDTEQHHHAGDENLFVLLEPHRFKVQL